MGRRSMYALVLVTALAVVTVGCASSPEISTYVLEPGAELELSRYLSEPSLLREHAIESAEFWAGLRDDEFGGYFSAVAEDGAVVDPHQKSLIVQSRNAYGFSRAFMLTGDTRYLEHAEHALEFLYEHGWDHENGGWFFSVDRDGDLLAYSEWWDPNTFRWSFSQHYSLLGISAMYEAARGEQELEWLWRGIDINNEELWDPVHGGYFEEANLDWSNKRGKGFTGTIDGITTHALSAYLTLGEPALEERLFALADITVDHLVASMDDPRVELGFAERYTNDWMIDPENSQGSAGHQLKVVWSLSRAYLLNSDRRYREAAERLFVDVLENGMYDTRLGGPYRNYNYLTGEVQRDRKNYWMTEQAIMAGLTFAQITTDRVLREQALAMASQTLDFYMEHFVDQTYGEIYSEVFPAGAVADTTKGDFFKGGYHNIETAYLGYLYAKTFVTDEPFTLYYSFPEAPEAREVVLTPIAAPGLRIGAVSVTAAGGAGAVVGGQNAGAGVTAAGSNTAGAASENAGGGVTAAGGQNAGAADTAAASNTAGAGVSFDARSRSVSLPPGFVGVLAVRFEPSR